MTARPQPLRLALSSGSEAELALCCASVAASGRGAAGAYALLGQPIDWERLARFAVRHGILPLVHQTLTSAFDGAMPADAARNISLQFKANAMRNLFLARELIRLTASLQRAGVATLAFKGPALAVSVYGSVSLRQFVDLDLLVHPEQVVQATGVLHAEGYVAPRGYDTREIGRRGAFETSMVKPDGRICIDLHWRLAEPYFPLSMDGEELWQRAMRVEIEGGEVSTFGFEDHLLYLCGHGARHGWETLGGICDLAQLMRTAPLDWGRVCNRAEHLGARRMLLLGLLLAHDLLDAQVPERLLEAARRDRAVVGAARTFVRYAADTASAGPGLYQRWSIPARMIERPGERIRYLAARALFPSADDHGFVRLPPALAPLYYVLRPLRIALKQSRAAMRRLQPSGAPSAGNPVR